MLNKCAPKPLTARLPRVGLLPLTHKVEVLVVQVPRALIMLGWRQVCRQCRRFLTLSR
jgi:hypothetical protein